MRTFDIQAHHTPQQHALIVELLKPDRIVKGPILINSVMTDGEAIQFGQQLLTVLKDAGFSPTDVPFGERLMGLSPGPGSRIVISSRSMRGLSLKLSNARE